MSALKGGGPAFPHDEKHDNGEHYYSNLGMSVRDYFAGQIASGMAAHSGTMGSCFGPGEIAQRSYEIADAMIAERSK